MMSQSVNSPSVKKPDPVDWATYDAGGFKPLPPPGNHLLKTTAVDFGTDLANPTRNKNGYLQAILSAEVIAPGQPFNGAKILFTRVNTQKWSNRNGNSMGDYLKAIGAKVAPQSDAEYLAAVKATLGSTFTAKTDWEIYDKASETNIKGTADLSRDGSGNPLPYVVKNGEKIYANSRVKFFIAKAS